MKDTISNLKPGISMLHRVNIRNVKNSDTGLIFAMSVGDALAIKIATESRTKDSQRVKEQPR